jgi:hypothetical protein
MVVRDSAKGLLFRTIPRDTGRLSMSTCPIAYSMVRRRAIAASIDTKIGNYTFRVTGITA